MQHLEHTYTKKLLIVYFNFKYGSSSCFYLLNLATLSGFQISLQYTKFTQRILGWKNRKELTIKLKGGIMHTGGLMENANLQHIKLRVKTKKVSSGM